MRRSFAADSSPLEGDSRRISLSCGPAIRTSSAETSTRYAKARRRSHGNCAVPIACSLRIKGLADESIAVVFSVSAAITQRLKLAPAMDRVPTATRTPKKDCWAGLSEVLADQD